MESDPRSLSDEPSPDRQDMPATLRCPQCGQADTLAPLHVVVASGQADARLLARAFGRPPGAGGILALLTGGSALFVLSLLCGLRGIGSSVDPILNSTYFPSGDDQFVVVFLVLVVDVLLVGLLLSGVLLVRGIVNARRRRAASAQALHGWPHLYYCAPCSAVFDARDPGPVLPLAALAQYRGRLPLSALDEPLGSADSRHPARRARQIGVVVIVVWLVLLVLSWAAEPALWQFWVDRSNHQPRTATPTPSPDLNAEIALDNALELLPDGAGLSALKVISGRAIAQFEMRTVDPPIGPAAQARGQVLEILRAFDAVRARPGLTLTSLRVEGSVGRRRVIVAEYSAEAIRAFLATPDPAAADHVYAPADRQTLSLDPEFR